MPVDCLTKKNHYIPYATNENGTTTEAIAQLLLQNIWKLHDLLLSLISDRGPQFILRVWKNLYKIFGISISLSISFHLKIDGQSEIANQEIEKHLYIFINYSQND